MHINILFRKALYVFMSLMIVIFSTQSANAAAVGWAATNADATINGATATIKAFKQGAAGAAQAVINHKPSASAVGKALMRAGGGLALALAATQLVDGALDWVLDPANNTLKYKHPADAPALVNGYWSNMWGEQFATHTLAIQSNCAKHNSGLVIGVRVSGSAYEHGCEGILGDDGVYAGSIAVGSYAVTINLDPQAPPISPPYPERSIPVMTTVANKVLANAAAGHKDSQDFVKAVAVGQANAGELDKALNAASVPATSTPTADAPTYVDPTLPTTGNPDAPTAPVDPTKPFDPSSILAALAGIKSVLTGFVDWWQAQWATFSTGITEFFQWVRAEPDTASLQPEPVEVSEGTLVDGWENKVNAGYVNMGGKQCPSDVLIPISYMGASTNLSLSYVPFCHFASIIRYAVILGAWVAALMIISGGRTKE